MIQVNERTKKLLKFTLGYPLTLISFVFIGLFIYSGKNEILSQVYNFKSAPFVAGIFFFLLFFLVKSYLWNELIKKEGHEIDTYKSFYLLASSEIKRYIPGGILSFVTRVSHFGNLGIANRTIVKLIFYESLIMVLSSVIVSIPGYFFVFRNVNLYISTIALITILLLSGALLTQRKKIDSKIFSLSVFMTLGWVFYGLGNFLVASSFTYIDPYRILQLSSFFILSWLAGYMVLVVPMGLGIREAVAISGLSLVMPLPIAASIALLTRIAFVVGEVLFLLITYIFQKYVRVKNIKRHLLILWFSILLYISYFTYYSFEKHANFFTGRFDLGNMDQTVWNTSYGRIFQLTNPDGVNSISRLAVHADYLLMLFSPFYYVWQDPRLLLLTQSAVLGMGAYFVYKIAHKVIKNDNLALVLSISYLLNPFVQKQNLFEFHAVTLSTTFLLASFYYVLIKKTRYFWIFLLLATLTKENVYLIATIYGLFLAIYNKNKKWILLSVGAFIMFYLTFNMFIPLARGGQHFATEYFQEYGDSPSAIMFNLILNPVNTTEKILTPSNIFYVYKLLLPVGFFTLVSPLYLIFVIPDIAINLLSKNENLKSLTFHYGATIVPFVYISAIYGVKRLIDLKNKIVRINFLTYVILFYSIFATYFYGVLPGSLNPSVEIYLHPVAESKKIENFLQSIPSDLSVSSTNNLGAHLSHRIKIYTIPHGIEEADVIAFLLNDPYAQPSLSEQREYARTIQNDPSYIELARYGDFIAFGKRSIAGKIPVSN